MRSQSAIFVDAGYLFAAAATRLTGSSFRGGLNVDYATLVSELTALVEDRASMPLLRVYWYDASRNGVADLEQEKIAALPRVKLRLGRLGFDGEQKGVDLRIGLDMVSHSRNGAVDTIYLLSGDDDLTEAVEEAQAQGVQVVILAVPTPSGTAHGVSKNIMRAADGVEVLEASALDASIIAIGATPPTESSGKAAGQPPSPTSPADLARRVSSATTAPTVVYSGSSGSRPYVAAEYHRDPADLTKTIDGVVAKTYDAWSSTATDAQHMNLLAGRPTIPSELDRALLVDLSAELGDYSLSDLIRVQLRSRFWEMEHRQ